MEDDESIRKPVVYALKSGNMKRLASTRRISSGSIWNREFLNTCFRISCFPGKTVFPYKNACRQIQPPQGFLPLC